MTDKLKRWFYIPLLSAAVLLTPVFLSPVPVFRAPLSTVVEASDGELLGARIADDGQWRFPSGDSVPLKFEKALLTFEDRYFYYHPGINPFSIMRALIHNIRAGEIVSGGSTITMQVARLSRGNRPRTYSAKIIEMFSALKLELLRSKKTILKLYTANAPFGGNIVGLEAAAWRYTGKAAANITWAEAATLAVLPNSPSLIFPGRNQEILKTRRDILLEKLYERGTFDSLTLLLALDEPLPGPPHPLPVRAPHLTDHFYKNARGQRIRTTIDPLIQERALTVFSIHQKDLSANFINNSAGIIADVVTGKVLAYIGNSTIERNGEHNGDVDIIRSMRSTGSILKPFLYAGMQQSGDILPDALIADIPSRFPGFAPENFDMSYSGAVPASQALSQSLNIPAVKMLGQFTPGKFLNLLRETGFTSFTRSADHYGLSLILGGGEISLWELTGNYASLSRILNRYNETGQYFNEDYHPLVLVEETGDRDHLTVDNDPPLSASAIWLTYEALKKVNRPVNETGWQFFSSSPDIAWKTGTSYGFRDAWAAGTTPQYVIGIWAGNADGEGRPGLTGITAAAPILFDLISIMGTSEWFTEPAGELTTLTVCSESGYRAGPDCPVTKEIRTCLNGTRSEVCPYHKIIHLDKSGQWQVNTACASPADIQNVPWFILPPAMEYFYRKIHPEYKVLPPLLPGCTSGKEIEVMEFLYPRQETGIFIPRDQTGSSTRMIAEIVHRNPSKKIFWHLDENYIATTESLHQMEIIANTGTHLLTAVDEDGNSIMCSFTIIGKTDQ